MRGLRQAGSARRAPGTKEVVFKHEREPEEASPLGIILCTGKKREQIELLELDRSGIHVAEYLTALPPWGVLVEWLQQAAERAQLQIEQCKQRS